jgi:N-acetylmuramoyl-L-alanine amidase
MAAERARETLLASAKRQKSRAEWDKVFSAYDVVVTRYPRSPYCDDALLAAGDLRREGARVLKARRLLDDALRNYASIVEEYPSSRLGEKALYAAWQIRGTLGQRDRARAAAEEYLDAYPKGPHATELKRSIVTPAARATASTDRATGGAKSRPEARSEAAPETPTESEARAEARARLAQVHAVRFWSGATSTRVVVDVARRVPIQYDRLTSPPRLFVDLKGARLHPNLVGPDRAPRTFPVKDGFLKQIRVGAFRDDVVRIVVDFEEATDHNVFFLPSPERLVIDIKGDAKNGRGGALRASRATSAAGVPPLPRPAPPSPESTPESEPQSVWVSEEPLSLPSPEDANPSSSPVPSVPSPSTASATPAASPSASVSVTASESRGPTPPSLAPNPDATPPAPRPRPTATPAVAVNSTPDAAEGPSRNADGAYSLARQLGLGARRIALDAGHGGHDPGAIGRGGAQEKDITLSVVLRLEKLIRRELGADVVLTRDRDVFIPLEERTAIANASGADLFLSVHINSARNPAGRGIETYYLSFAKNAAAEELAARENAISQATMKDLNNLVKAITTNSKIDESRDFAAAIQAGMVTGLGRDFRVQNRGVHTAPFYVLIGANMPSILAEVGFISNAEEERWLRSDDYQESLAQALLAGVRQYLSALSRDKTTRLAGRTGERVAGRARARNE